MKWTLKWLKDYLDTASSADQIADRLTEIGLEIESVETPGHPVVARVVERIDGQTGTRNRLCEARAEVLRLDAAFDSRAHRFAES